MEKIEKVLASGNTHATVNRDPNAQRGEFGVYDLKLTSAPSRTRQPSSCLRARGQPATPLCSGRRPN
jgi:hypothetical protein